MRILVCTQALDRDHPILGFAHDWVEALARRVERVVVVPVVAGRVELPANVDVRPLHTRLGGAAFQKLLRFRRVVGAACAAREVDAVFAHMVPRYAVYAAPFARPRRIPIFLWYTHKSVDWSLRLAVPVVARAFTASESSFRLRTNKKVVTGHGIDSRRFAPPGPADPAPTHDIAVVGRIAPAKDPLTLVEALGILAARGVRPRVVLAGDTLLDAHDAYREAVRARIAAFGLEESFEFLGSVPHPRVRDVFLKAPLFVTPSMTGSVDKTVLEAMSCARVPVTCNESFREVLGPLGDGLLFPPGDAAALAGILASFLAPEADAARMRELGAALRAIVVRDHDLERLMDRLVAEMEAVTHRGR